MSENKLIYSVSIGLTNGNIFFYLGLDWQKSNFDKLTEKDTMSEYINFDFTFGKEWQHIYIKELSKIELMEFQTIKEAKDYIYEFIESKKI